MGWEVDEEVNQDKNEAAQECAASIFQSQLLVLSEAQIIFHMMFLSHAVQKSI